MCSCSPGSMAIRIIETAAMLGLAEGTCKAQLHRARKLLSERLGVNMRGQE